MFNSNLIELAMILDGEERRLNAIIGRLQNGDTTYLVQGLELMLENIKKARELTGGIDNGKI